MEPAEIGISRLRKTFGPVVAVDDLSFTVRPGAVTGFLGPNGSGKTTTLRVLLGLMSPTSGSAMIAGVTYAQLHRPASVVGAALDSGFHPSRSGLDHLRCYAPQIGVPDSRCHEVLELVGLSEAKKRRVGGYSMGMRQRLGLATALLGDPPVLILDEPANGLDPQGVVWLRQLLRYLAGEGRTVLVSSHVLAEVQSTVDDVVIIAEGRLVKACPLVELADLAQQEVVVRAADPAALADLAGRERWATQDGSDALVVSGVTAAEVGAACFTAGIELHQLTDRGVDLEEVFLRLTAPAGAA